MIWRPSRRAVLVWLSAVACQRRSSEPLRVAVASNFLPVAKRLGATFEQSSGHAVEFSSGATGALAAQIESGAPFDVFLAADSQRPLALQRAGLAEAPFEYARGKLALVTAKPLEANEAALGDPRLEHLALANPRLAPYGAAAVSALREAKRWDVLEKRVVLGENVSQTLHFVLSGAAQAGLVPEALARDAGKPFWPVPEAWYEPIVQRGAVLIRTSHPASRDFARMLQSAASRRVIAEAGYALPPDP